MKFYDLQRTIKGAYFTINNLRLRGVKIYPYQLSLWVKNGKLKRLKRGIYYFPEKKGEIKPEEIAVLIYEPSYISTESALSHYSLIPDKVFSITSVATKPTRRFSNDFGQFIYQQIKPELFFGYNAIGTQEGKYLLAEPEKAILDYFYLHLGQIDNIDDIKELRFNYRELKDIISLKRLRQYLKVFSIAKLERVINLLLQQC